MKTARNLLPILFLALLVGCAATPQKRWAVAREGLSSAQDSVRTSNVKLTVAQIDYLDIGFKSARGFLADAEKALPNGGPTFDDDLKLVQSVIDQVETVWLRKRTIPQRVAAVFKP